MFIRDNMKNVQNENPDQYSPHDIRDNSIFKSLSQTNQSFISKIAADYRLTYMDLLKIITAACDLEMWGIEKTAELWPKHIPHEHGGKQYRQKILKYFFSGYESIKASPRSYKNIVPDLPSIIYSTQILSNKKKILGKCPVASEKTRCCNLQTLDAVINCGFACTYCAIAPFYGSSAVSFHSDLDKQLNAIDIQPDKLYHIGTGQSSDSLMFGNKHGILDKLFSFAEKHPNVILELKTKASLPIYMQEKPIPRNVITTWTLNTPSIIAHEEKGTARLDERINGAFQITKKGNVTGFHFHPIVYYDGWQDDYSDLAEKVLNKIDPSKVAMVSLGTLTFIKPVLRQIRERKLHSSILRMPMEETAGKYSYPQKLKLEMFSHLYNCFKPWHGRVFFYLCMEPASLWRPVFGYEYADNDQFEAAMKKKYYSVIDSLS